MSLLLLLLPKNTSSFGLGRPLCLCLGARIFWDCTSKPTRCVAQLSDLHNEHKMTCHSPRDHDSILSHLLLPFPLTETSRASTSMGLDPAGILISRCRQISFFGQTIRSKTMRMKFQMFLQRLRCHGLQRVRTKRNSSDHSSVYTRVLNLRLMCGGCQDFVVSTNEDSIVRWRARILWRLSSKRPSPGPEVNSRQP